MEQRISTAFILVLLVSAIALAAPASATASTSSSFPVIDVRSPASVAISGQSQTIASSPALGSAPRGKVHSRSAGVYAGKQTNALNDSDRLDGSRKRNHGSVKD